MNAMRFLPLFYNAGSTKIFISLLFLIVITKLYNSNKIKTVVENNNISQIWTIVKKKIKSIRND